MASRETQPGAPPPLPAHDASGAPGAALAGLGTRFLALLMDVVPIAVLTAFLLWRILLPLYHGEAQQALIGEINNHYDQVRLAEETGGEKPSTPDFTQDPRILLLFSFAHQVMFLAFFVYFGLSEWLMRGSSLGKKMFSIRTVMADTGLPPTAIQALLRGVMKAFGLIGLPPWTWISLLLASFLRGRRTGHDVLCRTAVISGVVPPRPKPREEPDF